MKALRLEPTGAQASQPATKRRKVSRETSPLTELLIQLGSLASISLDDGAPNMVDLQLPLMLVSLQYTATVLPLCTNFTQRLLFWTG